MQNPAVVAAAMRRRSDSSGGPTARCSKAGLRRGPWTAEEDEALARCLQREGEGRWRTVPKRAGLLRCGKSCRLRWMNYLRPSIKRGRITPDEEDLILRLHRLLGNRWSLIAGRIPGRTDNEIKNYWNTHLCKKLISQGIDPRTHKPLNPNTQPKKNHELQLPEHPVAPLTQYAKPHLISNPDPNHIPRVLVEEVGGEHVGIDADQDYGGYFAEENLDHGEASLPSSKGFMTMGLRESCGGSGDGDGSIDHTTDDDLFAFLESFSEDDGNNINDLMQPIKQTASLDVGSFTFALNEDVHGQFADHAGMQP